MDNCLWETNDGYCRLCQQMGDRVYCEFRYNKRNCNLYVPSKNKEQKETNSMNEKLTNLINGLGAFTEMWMVIFANFKAQNMDEEAAIKHTKALMEALLGMFIPNVDEGVKE